ncbi:MAG: hypothetical protein IPP31_12630 [Chitinophagaceae bacterium]|nr:hypothetical protein [Chitinophagaceae bacterium]
MFIPQFMQHYILVPANFPVGAANFSLFAKNAKEVARSVFGITLQSNSMPEGSEAYATFFKQMDKHIDAHFGGGKFIFNSQMEHPNLP